MSEKPIIIKTAKTDNVGIVVNLNGLPKGTLLDDGTLLSENVPIGHKVALNDISEGDKIIRYGQIIGYANKTDHAWRMGPGIHDFTSATTGSGFYTVNG